MTTIVEGKNSIVKLLGKQRLRNTEYRLIKYVLREDCENGILLHNVITGKLVLLNKEEAAFVEKLPCFPKECACALINDYFLVPVSYNEKELVDGLRALINKAFPSKGINNYTILTTTNCNARCFYCYENNYKHINMSAETASCLTEYMINQKDGGMLRIEWFGGEPLLCSNRIDQICYELKQKGIKFVSGITSNGYLFDKLLVSKAVSEWNLNHIQITIDGTEEIYNKTKSYVSVKGSPYKRVMKNVRLLLDSGVIVSVRLNLDLHNEQDLKALIDELKSSFANYSNLIVYVHVTFRGSGYCPIKRSDLEERSLYIRQVEFNKYIEQLGLSKPRKELASLNTHSCTADNDNSIIVYPDGTLYKCEHLNEGDRVGSINSQLKDTNNYLKYKITITRDGCDDCPLYPKCMLLKECPGIDYCNDQTCAYNIEIQHGIIQTRYNEYINK